MCFCFFTDVIFFWILFVKQESYIIFAGVTNSAREEENIGAFSALKNVGKSTKDGVLGTASVPIHMVTAEGGHFKEQLRALWRTICTIIAGFIVISGVGVLTEDTGIGKGITIKFFNFWCDLDIGHWDN